MLTVRIKERVVIEERVIIKWVVIDWEKTGKKKWWLKISGWL